MSRFQSWFKPELHSEAGRSAMRDIRLGLLLIVVMFGGFGGWLALVPVDGAVIGDGVVRVADSVQKVQTATSGVVKQILVRDGDQVKAGQPLFILHDAELNANYTLYSTMADAERAKQARLESEQRFSDKLAFPASLLKRQGDARVGEILGRERDLFAARRHTVDAQIDLLQQQQQDAEREYERKQAMLKARRDSLSLLREQLEAERSLTEKQYITRQRLLELERLERQVSADVFEIEADAAAVQQKINDLALRRVTAKSGYMQTAATELKDSNNRLTEIEEHIGPSREAAEKQVVTAPMSGQAFNLRVHTLGELVSAGAVLMEVVPAGSERIIETVVPVKDIRYVHIGGKGSVRLSAYNPRTTPEVAAWVSYVAPDRRVENGVPQDGYVVRLKLDPESLKQAEISDVQPGMSGTVFIQTGRRTMIEYILQPFIDSFSRAFREVH